MKIGKMLIQLGKKLTGKKEEVKKDEGVQTLDTNSTMSTNDTCWWIIYEPKTPKIFKD